MLLSQEEVHRDSGSNTLSMSWKVNVHGKSQGIQSTNIFPTILANLTFFSSPNNYFYSERKWERENINQIFLSM